MRYFGTDLATIQKTAMNREYDRSILNPRVPTWHIRQERTDSMRSRMSLI
jgi:hypothetical protein